MQLIYFFLKFKLPHKSVQELIEYYHVVWRTTWNDCNKTIKLEEVLVECSVGSAATSQVARPSLPSLFLGESTTLLDDRDSTISGGVVESHMAGGMTTATGARLCISCGENKPACMFRRIGASSSSFSSSFSAGASLKRSSTPQPTDLQQQAASTAIRELKQLKRRSLLVDSKSSSALTSSSSNGVSNTDATLASENGETTNSSQVKQQSFSNKGGGGGGVRLEKICLPCQIYWKKHAVFKNGWDPNSGAPPVNPRQDPTKRLERIEALKNQVIVCDEPGCGLHFGKAQLYKRHLRFAHDLPDKKRSVDFCLRPSRRTRKTRGEFFRHSVANRALLRRLAVSSWTDAVLVGYGNLKDHGNINFLNLKLSKLIN